jgi:hypothetical protein
VSNRGEEGRFPDKSLVDKERVQARHGTANTEPGALDEVSHRLFVHDRQQLEPLAVLARVPHDDAKRAGEA